MNLYAINNLGSVFDSHPQWKEVLPLIDGKEQPQSSQNLVDEEAQTLEDEIPDVIIQSDDQESNENDEPAFTAVVVEKNVDQMEIDEEGAADNDITSETPDEESVENMNIESNEETADTESKSTPENESEAQTNESDMQTDENEQNSGE